MSDHDIAYFKCLILVGVAASIIVPVLAVSLFQRMPVSKMLKSFWRAGLLISAGFILAGAFWPTDFQLWSAISRLPLRELSVIHAILQIDVFIAKLAAFTLSCIVVSRLIWNRISSS